MMVFVVLAPVSGMAQEPPPRGDALEPVGPDSDLLHSAAGHVRAAGMRL